MTLQPRLHAFIFPAISPSVVLAFDAEEASHILAADVGRDFDWRTAQWTKLRLHTDESFTAELLELTVEKLHELEEEIEASCEFSMHEVAQALRDVKGSVAALRRELEPS